jgi:diguanylate cyclase (GGDEF)-like protein
MDTVVTHSSKLHVPVTPVDRAIVHSSPLLASVDRGMANTVLAGCRCLVLTAGDTLLAPGDCNTSLFVLTRGRLLIYLEEPHGKHYLALEPGECAGEMSFIDARPASAHVIASMDSRVVEIGREILWSLVDEAPEFARSLLRVMAARVRNDNEHLQRSFHLQREYEQAAKTDLLTGVHNRRWMDEMFPRQLARAERAGQPLALLMIDIDHFKRLNDTYGHATGDVVLKAVARLLSDTLRPTDMLVRYGGEEFAAMLPGTTEESAMSAAERVRRAIEQSQHLPTSGGPPVKVTISIGVAVLRPDEQVDGLIERADSALYRAKADGRNRILGAGPG